MKQRNMYAMILFGCSIAACAQQDNPVSPATSQANTATQSASPTPASPAVSQPQQSLVTENGQQYSIQQILCPKPSELVKNGLYWGTPVGGWKSYAESFDTSITSFQGAQWVGVNVGKMICIYKGNLAMAFPITIQNDTLAQTPSGGLWGNDLGGYRNCHSSNMADCPFTIKNQVTNMQDIYNSLDFFKGKPDPLNNTTSQDGPTSGNQQ